MVPPTGVGGARCPQNRQTLKRTSLPQVGEVFCMQGQVQGRDGLVGWGMGNLHSPQGLFRRANANGYGLGKGEQVRSVQGEHWCPPQWG